MVQALSDGAAPGELTLTLGPARGQRDRSLAHAVDRRVPGPDAAVTPLIERRRAPQRATLEAPVATAADRIGRRYRSESPFDALTGEILHAHSGTDIAFLPGVGYGVALEPGVVTREVFEELGLVFFKFGQVLAMRRNLLPRAYIAELARLHDELPAMGFDTVRATVEREPGAPLTALSSSFDETPPATAMIAQVHRATTQDGRAVAVKVQRPGLDVTIATDITTLTYPWPTLTGVRARRTRLRSLAHRRRQAAGTESKPAGHISALAPLENP